MGNLVDNALRYRRQAAVQVRFESRSPWLVIHVLYDGPGISAANRSDAVTGPTTWIKGYLRAGTFFL